MPFYEYECTACGNVFEILTPPDPAGEETTCPACGSAETRRVLSTTAWLGGSSAPGGGCAPRGGFG